MFRQLIETHNTKNLWSIKKTYCIFHILIYLRNLLNVDLQAGVQRAQHWLPLCKHTVFAHTHGHTVLITQSRVRCHLNIMHVNLLNLDLVRQRQKTLPDFQQSFGLVSVATSVPCEGLSFRSSAHQERENWPVQRGWRPPDYDVTTIRSTVWEKWGGQWMCTYFREQARTVVRSAG